jgi:cytochrome c oxidase subunit IV
MSHHDDHAPDIKKYMLVFGALLVLTLVTVGISKLHMERGPAIALGLAVALVKAGLVGAFFMHLWGEKKLIHQALWVTGFLALGLIVVIIDSSLLAPRITMPVSVKDQHPVAHEAAHEPLPHPAKPNAPAARTIKPSKATKKGKTH